MNRITVSSGYPNSTRKGAAIPEQAPKKNTIPDVDDLSTVGKSSTMLNCAATHPMQMPERVTNRRIGIKEPYLWNKDSARLPIAPTPKQRWFKFFKPINRNMTPPISFATKSPTPST